MSTTAKRAKGSIDKDALALQGWLEQMPALAAALDAGTTPESRAVLLEDVAADTWVLDQAAHAHPVLRARGCLAHAAIRLLAGDAAGAVSFAQRAAELGDSLAAPGPRLAILPQAGAVMGAAAVQLRSAQRHEIQPFLVDIAEATAEAYAEQAELSLRGVATLTAALALVEGAKRVRGDARFAVLSRARDLAFDARRDLAQAGEVAKAKLASDTVATLDVKLSS